MNSATGQRVLVSLVSSTIGTLVLKLGIQTIVDERTRRALEAQQPSLASPDMAIDVVHMGMALIGLGLILLILGGKTLGTTIAGALVKIPKTHEEVWDSISDSLADRLSRTVLKGYRKVTIPSEDAIEVMRLRNQNHIKLVGKEGTVIEMSGIMAAYIKKQLLLENKQQKHKTASVVPQARPAQQVTQIQQTTHQMAQTNSPSL